MKKEKDSNRKILIVNQATNYLTIGLCNAFHERFENVTLLTGSIHTQGEKLNSEIKVHYLTRYNEKPSVKKFYSYIVGCIHILFLIKTKFRKHEILFISVPPMAYLLNLLVSNRFSMLIWDVYPDILKITGLNEKSILYRTWCQLNRRSFKKAFRIFTIGEKISEALAQYVDPSKISVLPIWSIFQSNVRISAIENHFIEEYRLENKFVIQYSGNIGLTHNIELMVRIAEKLQNNEKLIFQIIGRGPRLLELKKLVKEKELINCQFLPFQEDEKFLNSISACDLGIVILDKRVSQGSVPSKSYNLMSLGIPSLYLASDDSELHIYSEKFRHAECYSEQEMEEAIDFILKISSNMDLWKTYSENALKAAGYFKRSNADRFVETYITC